MSALSMSARRCARVISLACLAAAALVGPAAAAPPSPPDGAPPQGGGHHRPPPFAYEACEGISADAVCTVELPDGNTLSGKCTADENDALYCHPDHMPKPQDQR